MENIIMTSLFDAINEYSKIEVNQSNYEGLDLLSDCDYDSIQIIELICTIEELFCIVLEDEYYIFDKIRNISELYEYIKSKVAASGAT